jgi:hypothetical protein
MSITAFLAGLAATVYGVATIKYNYRYTNLFNRSAFIEAWFGSMYTFMLITSIAACIIGLLAMTGLWNNFAGFVTSPVQGLFGNGSTGVE